MVVCHFKKSPMILDKLLYKIFCGSSLGIKTVLSQLGHKSLEFLIECLCYQQESAV